MCKEVKEKKSRMLSEKGIKRKENLLDSLTGLERIIIIV
jgi:hypothetical protein